MPFPSRARLLQLIASLAILCTALAPAEARAQGDAPTIRVAMVGLVHGHVLGWLRNRYATQFHIAPSLFYPTEAEMLAHVKPQAVLVYTDIADHRAAIEEAARHGIGSMVEKPLSTTLADALAIQQVSRQYKVPVLVNYETTWYASNTAAAKLLWSGQIGDLRKMVVHDGHKGPKEIGVGPEFLGWLTDPVKNGAGALFDFGCYGVDLATWLMHGQQPLSVTAVTLQIKPDVYPKVDDEGTIILTYPKAEVIIQGSWNWPFDRKDMEVYGATGYVDTVAKDGLRIRLPGEAAEHTSVAQPLAAPEDTPLHLLSAVLEGKIQPDGDLSALDTNVTVMRILDAARTSAKTGRTVKLQAAQ